MVRQRRSVGFVVALVALFCAICAFIVPQQADKVAFAANATTDGDGTYTVSYTVGGTSSTGESMIRRYFGDTLRLERSGENYYLTFTLSDNTAMTDFALSYGDMQVGCIEVTSGTTTSWTYTFDEAAVQSTLSLSCNVPAMSMTVSFTVTPNLASATKTSDSIEDIGERPARFVPVITTSAGSSYELEKGSVFTIPSATAALGSESVDVTVSAVYIASGAEEQVDVTGNQITLSQAGTYRLIYTASSSTYLTSLGNPTSATYEVTITSKIGATSVAKFEDTNGVLSDGAALQASYVTTGTVYETAAAQMKTIADKFQVVSVIIYAADGSEVTPADNITLYIMPRATYDRTEVVVYHMADDGTLTQIACSPYGRYVSIDTDLTGTFIVCIPGVAFVMPMWGWILIAVGCLLVLAAAITTTILLIRRTKRNRHLASLGPYTRQPKP